MTTFSVLSRLLVLSAALFLSGCFVTSTHAPLANGPSVDEALLGDWRSVDADSDEEEDVFLHIQKQGEGKPLRIVFVEKDDYQIYELHSSKAGKHTAFAIKTIAPEESVKKAGGKFFLGYYEVKSDEIRFFLLGAEEVSKAIRQGRLKGKASQKQYDFAHLSGSPAELSQFLASEEGWNARISEPTNMRRISREQ